MIDLATSAIGCSLYLEMHNAQRDGDRHPDAIERSPVAHRSGEDNVPNPDSQVVADDAGEVVEEICSDESSSRPGASNYINQSRSSAA
jgi:hypothetical protein